MAIAIDHNFVKAFATCFRTDPEETISAAVEKLLARAASGMTVDAHYLLAWAYTRHFGLSYTNGVRTCWLTRVVNIDSSGDALEGEVEASAGHWLVLSGGLGDVWGVNPKESERSFDRSHRDGRNNEGFIFAQAMLHQGRAMNQIMYSLR